MRLDFECNVSASENSHSKKQKTGDFLVFEETSIDENSIVYVDIPENSFEAPIFAKEN